MQSGRNLLLVSKFSTDYIESLKQLTAVVTFFQNNRLFRPQTHPDLPEQIPQLSLELVTLSMSEQNELWSALKVAYHPSVVYKVRLLYIQTEETDLSIEIRETENKLATP